MRKSSRLIFRGNFFEEFHRYAPVLVFAPEQNQNQSSSQGDFPHHIDLATSILQLFPVDTESITPKKGRRIKQSGSESLWVPPKTNGHVLSH